MSRIKVLFEAGPMMDAKKTGVGYFVDHLTSSLQKNYSKQLDLTGYFFNFLKRNKEATVAEDLKMHRVWLMPGKILSLCRRLGFQPFLDIFVSKKVDLVLFTNYVSLPSIRHHKKALVIYDLGFLDHPEYIQDHNLAYLKRFCGPSIRNADLIVTISEFTKSRIREHYPELEADIVVTPIPPAAKTNGSAELPTRLKAIGIREESFILYVGTIEPRKNLQNLVRAYAALDEPLRKQYPLVIAGGKGWKYEATLEEISQLQEQGVNIILAGYVSDPERHSLYSNASCFFLPSHYEGFGMPILEAMQYKLPVAVSDIAVFREVSGNAALFFDKDISQSITTAMHKLLTDDNLRKSLVRESTTLLKQYNWEESATRVFRAFSETCSK